VKPKLSENPPDERMPTASSFGEKLRRAREARGISLKEISEQTRISTRFLESIESNDYKQLPGGIFNRSFIKSYAKYVGLDEDEVVDSYLRIAREHGDIQDEGTLLPHQPRVYTDGNTSRTSLLSVVLAVVILSIIILGGYAGLHWYQRQMQPAPQQPPQRANNRPANNPVAEQPVAPPAANQPQPVPAELKVELKATKDQMWVNVKTDDNQFAGLTLLPNEVKSFLPEQKINLTYSKSQADGLEVTINGRKMKPPAETTNNLVQVEITRENFAQHVQ
jgi:cytoskeleton protein RodZ